MSKIIQVKNKIRKIKSLFLLIKANPDLLQKGVYILKNQGLPSLIKKVKKLPNSYAYYNIRQNDNSLGSVNHNPLVSIIAVNYNGKNDLDVFIKSILNQSYKNFELLIVDNASNDGSKIIIKEYEKRFKKIKLIESKKNLGFAEGNNFALNSCKGEFIALINVDTKADKEWLKELVDAISCDNYAAAATSKTLFFEKFQDALIEGDKSFILDLNCLIDSLSYKKYFIRQGVVNNNTLRSKNNKIIISLPIQNKPINFFIKPLNISKELKISIKIGKNRVKNFISSNKFNISLDFSENSVINGTYIINNAGSITKYNMPADRGIGEYDIGQYDSKCYIDFFCGVSVLLRRSAIINRTIFVPEFFAYYEDSELSRWLRENGYKILYVPRSVLFHKHSATSSEGSSLWQLLVSRSQSIYKYNGDIYDLEVKLNTIEEKYKKEINIDFLNNLKHFSRDLISRLKSNNNLVKSYKAVGIYNSYWNTKGGGESHALSFAEELQKNFTVFLISEQDFDIDELSNYYGLDLSGCRKIIQSEINTHLTEKFYIFINSTYRSNLISRAKKSYYIVSFPHKNVKYDFLQSYTFLHNSDYTAKWANIFWKEKINSKVVYPIGMLKKQKLIDSKKEKIILNVGRFFVGNHCKNQLFIAKLFKELSLKYNLSDWKLVLVGSIDMMDEDAIKYLNRVKVELNGLNHSIITNAKKTELDNFYKKAYIYVHATGVNSNKEKNPDEFEHFGITPIEAMTFGSIPIIYEVGGAADLIKKLGVGEVYKDKEELENILYKYIQDFESNCNKTDKTIRVINKFIDRNSFNKVVYEIFLNKEF